MQLFAGGGTWIQSYFVKTIGNATEEIIRRYVWEQLNVMDRHEEAGKQLGFL